MANQESKQPVYKDHLTAWRPDYPMVWNFTVNRNIFDFESEPKNRGARAKNIIAFSATRDAIAKCIGQC